MSILFVVLFYSISNSLANYKSTDHYDYRLENWSKWSFIYEQYLNKTGIGPNCGRGSGKVWDIIQSDIKDAFLKAENQIKDLREKDKIYLERDPRGLSFSPFLYEANLQSIYNGYATKNLMISECLSEYEVAIDLPKLSVSSSKNNWNQDYCRLETDLSPDVKCDPKYKYRRFDGKCNNLIKTGWGSAVHCQRRLLPPDFGDGVYAPRRASDNSILPNARLITTSLMPEIEVLDFERTKMQEIWGQFIAHDVIKTPQMFGLAMNCCPPDGQTSVHSECMSANNIPRDKLAVAFNQSCIGFVRSLGCKTCSLGSRNQLSMTTPFLDLSHIYGTTDNESMSLRSFYKGEMSLMSIDGHNVLPKAQLPEDQDRADLTQCKAPSERPWLTCFRTGDGIRGNQNPLSVSMNIIHIERHNQHCRGLAKVNPHWDDERLFQVARQISIAEYNQINFGEFLSTLLDKQTMDYYDLNPRKDGFTKYNPEVNPSIIQSFGVAAFRYGHSQVTSTYRVIKEHDYESYGFRLRDKYFDTSQLWDGEKCALVKGMCEDPTGRVDSNFAPDVHDYLFFPKCSPRIIDLPAINIMRGQDHGVAAYVYYLEYCTGKRVQHWDDLNELMDSQYVRQLKLIYKNVRDVDLFVGGLAEKPKDGSIVGPTFGCLIAKQFYHLKHGDRYYYENGGEAGSFNKDQLNNIREVAWMANLLCKTCDLQTIQTNAFLMPSKDNPFVFCDDLQEFNYSLWKESSSKTDRWSDTHKASY